MKTYRAAIVGLGRMASTIDQEVVDYPSITLPYSIAGACQQVAQIQLVAGADISDEKRQAFQKRSLGNVEVTHQATEACLAVAESHRQGGKRVNLPLESRELYVWHV